MQNEHRLGRDLGAARCELHQGRNVPDAMSDAWLAVRVIASAEPFDGSIDTSRPASRKYPRSSAW